MHRYSNNAFRVLGLLPTASHAEVMHRGNEIKIKRSLGVDVAYEYDFPWMGKLDRSEENVIHAMQHIEDSVLRFNEELSWFWSISDTDKAALSLLMKNQRKQAHDVWGACIRNSSSSGVEKCSAGINQAILAHSSVVGKESCIEYSEVDNENVHGVRNVKGFFTCPRCKKTCDVSWNVCLDCGLPKKGGAAKSKQSNVKLEDNHSKNWIFALNKLSSIPRHEYFWETVNEKIKRINDPRLSVIKAKEICNQYFQSILVDPNLMFLAQALINKDYARARIHSLFLNGAEVKIARDGLNRILNHHINSLNVLVDVLNKDVVAWKNNPSINAILALYDNFSSKSDILYYEANLVDYNNTTDFLIARDDASRALRNISVEIHNRYNEYDKSYEILRKAISYAGSSHQKQLCENDEKLVKEHVEISRAAKKNEAQIVKKTSGRQLMGWIVGGVVLLLIIYAASQDKQNTSSSSVATTTSGSYRATYSSNAESRSALIALKDKMEGMKALIAQQEKRLQEINSMVEQTKSKMTTLRTAIENIKNEYGNDSDIPEYVAQDYNYKIQEYNNLVPVYNNYVTQGQSMYIDYENNLKEVNRLISIYNRELKNQ